MVAADVALIEFRATSANGGSHILAGSLRNWAVVVTGYRGVGGVLPFLIWLCLSRTIFKQRCWHKKRLQYWLTTQCVADMSWAWWHCCVPKSRCCGESKNFGCNTHATSYVWRPIRAAVYVTFMSHVTEELIKQKSNKRALYWTLLPFHSSSVLYVNTAISQSVGVSFGLHPRNVR